MANFWMGETQARASGHMGCVQLCVQVYHFALFQCVQLIQNLNCNDMSFKMRENVQPMGDTQWHWQRGRGDWDTPNRLRDCQQI